MFPDLYCLFDFLHSGFAVRIDIHDVIDTLFWP